MLLQAECIAAGGQRFFNVVAVLSFAAETNRFDPGFSAAFAVTVTSLASSYFSSST
jgi:hypothetical protein